MRGNSQESRDQVLRAFDPVISAAGKDGVVLANQLFGVVDTLDGSGSLRRALSDPARSGHDKGTVVDALFTRLDSRVRDVVRAFVAQRWSAEIDLAESIEDAGVLALLATAEADGTLDAVEEQLFRLERALVAERELLVALGDRLAPRASRVALLTQVLAGVKLAPVTVALVDRAVAAPRGSRLITTIKRLVVLAAERRNRSVAHVTAAVELSAAQRKRLAEILKAAYGREVHINVAVDPQVLGGIKVQVGSEVVDGTVLARLDDARRRLVG